MATIITRSACEPGGICHRFGAKPLPPNVARIVIDHTGAQPRYVTWNDILAERRRKQARILEYIRMPCTDRRAAFVRVFYNPHFIYMGWHTYVHTIGEAIWVRRHAFDNDANPFNLLTLFPMTKSPGPLFPPEPVTDFEEWMRAFARVHQRHNRRWGRHGLAFCWAIFSRGHLERLEP